MASRGCASTGSGTDPLGQHDIKGEHMRFKKLICIGLSLVMIASAAGCGGATGAASAVSEPAAAAEPAAAEPAGTEAAEPAAAEAAAEPAAEPAAADATATTAAADEIPAADISVTWEDSRVYPTLSLGKFITITTYGVKGYEDVPFIKATDYLRILFEGKERVSMENGVMKVVMNGAEAVIDPAADTIRFDDTASFRSTADVNGAVVEWSEYNVVTPSAKNPSTQTDPVPLTISLKEYHMPVVAYEDDIIMPFLALQNTFGTAVMKSTLAYNGKDYYNAFDAINFATDDKHKPSLESPYYKAIYSGPFREKGESTQAYADYGYYATCLQLDLTFGHKEEKNITTFDEYFTRMNAKKAMCSTTPSSAVSAEAMLFYYLFDSGHDALFSFDTVFGRVEEADQNEVAGIVEDIKASEEGQELFDDSQDYVDLAQDENPVADAILGALFEKGFKFPEVLPLYSWTVYFESKKPEDYGEEKLDYADDTAVIYFEYFEDNTETRTPSYYLDPIKEEDTEDSTFAFFYKCFEDIKTHDEVKNIVINLSDNGGGAAAALVSVLGFLSEDGEVKITDRDLLTGNYREEWYHVDTNLDGIADDEDGYGGQYNFYILCSGHSYSCGNALPYFAQQEGLATIIGTNPGGGDCVVNYFIDAYGRCAYYSGMLKLGKEDANGFVSNEKATTVDLSMMSSILDIKFVPWFDPEGIANAVHLYQTGVTVLDYSEEKSEALSDLMQTILEKVAEASEESAAEGSTSAQQ